MARTNGARPERTATREAMVRDQIQRRGITDQRVLQALREVPRHCFVPLDWDSEAYSDRPLPIGEGQTISQPYMVAKMIESLDLAAHARVLEVGTGSGYQAAVLSQIAEQVYTIEYFPSLAEKAKQVLSELEYENIAVIIGDGSRGISAHAPYDGIIVAAAAPRIPPALTEQLSEGARLVIPVGNSKGQDLLIVTRRGDTFSIEHTDPCRFVPLLGEQGWSNPSTLEH